VLTYGGRFRVKQSRKEFVLLALAGLAAGALMVATAPSAAADRAVMVTCDQVITADTKLANDLIDCPRHGLVIGASNITLDLNGHTVDGNNVLFEPCPVDESCNVGIANSGLRDGRPFNGAGFSGVTVKNGTIREFAEVGVYIRNTSDNTVRDIKASTSDDESAGVILRGCTHCRVEHTSVSDMSVGIVLDRSIGARIEHNNIQHVGFAGVALVVTEGSRIAHNSIHDSPDTDGIVVLAESHHNVVTDNESFNNGGGLSIVGGSHHNALVRNSLHDNAFVGMFVNASDDNRIESNYIARNAQAAFDAGEGSDGGIHLTADDGDTSDRNVITKNTLVGNFGDGLLVDAGQGDTRIERNVARGNWDDGIDVESAETTIVGNAANNNHDLGIEAVAGVVDGGRNRAAGNGDPRQCINVACG
jgi:large repetitive protein